MTKRETTMRLLRQGETESLRGNSDRAVELYKEAVVLAPRSPDARYKLGAAQFVKGLTRKALDNPRHAVQLASGMAPNAISPSLDSQFAKIPACRKFLNRVSPLSWAGPAQAMDAGPVLPLP